MENIPRMELIQVAENVAREKLIEKEDVILAMEDAIQKAARSKYGLERDIRANINRNNGAISIEQFTQVVDDVVDEATQMSLSEAQRRDTSLKVGDFYKKVLPPFDFGRIAAQSAKQVISQKVRDAERLRQFNQFKDRVGEIILGTVKRFDNFSVTLDIGKAEGVIRKDEMIPREQLKPGDRVRTYILNVSEEIRGPQIFLSRSSNEFLRLLFTQEVPEIYDGIIEVKNVAREPGSRAKISVFSKDNTIDPVGACVGMRGSRVQAVVNELQGEKIDIVNWSEDPAIVVSNALSPAEVQRVNVDNDLKKLDVILTEENLSKAIGRRGQNVRLATKLLNFEINIMTDEEDSERRQIEFKEKTENFVKNLELDETLGQLLVAEGFSSIDDIKDSSVESLIKIEGIEEATAKALIDRAKEFYQKDQEEISNKIKDLGLDNELINHKGLTPGMLVTLGEQKILKLSDFADLASDELTGGYDILKGERIRIKGYLEDFALSKDEADELIMSARNKIYKD